MKISLNDLVELLEMEKQTIDEKLQSVKIVSTIGSSKNHKILLFQCAKETKFVKTLPIDYHVATVTSKSS